MALTHLFPHGGAVGTEGAPLPLGDEQRLLGVAQQLVTVTAVTGETEDGRKEISTIIVPNGTPGFTVEPPYDKVGWNASDTHPLTFDGARVPADNLLGERGSGFRNFLSILDEGRIAIAALSVGLAQGCIDESVRYLHERHAFGKPLIEHQAVAFRLADMATQIAVARQMVHYAAALRDSGKPALVEASMAKLFASEMAEKVCSAALQTLGGYGYLSDFPLERIYRDVRVCQIYEGTSDIQRMVISRNL